MFNEELSDGVNSETADTLLVLLPSASKQYLTGENEETVYRCLSTSHKYKPSNGPILSSPPSVPLEVTPRNTALNAPHTIHQHPDSNSYLIA
jgi:hypothetical protein